MSRATKIGGYCITVTAAVVLAILYFRQRAAVGSHGTASLYLVLLLLAVLVLTVLCILDIKQMLTGRVEQWLVESSSGATQPAPEVEEAQKVRASGDPLEAIRLLREYLQANPYELHVMSRIAEIYRYDLNNDLAAALEYEELLKHKLPDDQWSWAALHLAKLYGRLNELDKSVALLERLDTKFSHTIAGRRAKKALEAVRNPGGASEDDDAQPEGEVG